MTRAPVDSAREAIADTHERYQRLRDAEELRLLGGLEPRYERSRGTWYPASRDTGDPAWVPGERSATYKTKYDCESAIAAHDAREERQRNGTQGKASAAGAEEE